MKQHERRQYENGNRKTYEIVGIVNQKTKISVDFLVDKFSVSAITIRNDLKLLERNNLLIRAHGFAIANALGINELSINEKPTQNAPIKSIIAQQACKFIHE
ncbi:DeoR family transcriptional regulator [Psychromonas hadalis]|uniref:DeoR family transcriptional regulator n=1 Tax=Psychromonas hadalis TaxID=211669 RepID=UPI0003B3FFBD|nr:DeoR family transcriptional regulator [Psychromonas hadalis]